MDPAFKGEFVEPPPYVEEPPPPAFSAVDQTPNVATSTAENQGFEADDDNTSGTGLGACGTTRDDADQPPSNNSE